MENAHTRTLTRALEITGSLENLAFALDTDVEALRTWLSGQSRAPADAYLKALDIVSGRGYARRTPS